MEVKKDIKFASQECPFYINLSEVIRDPSGIVLYQVNKKEFVEQMQTTSIFGGGANNDN